MNTCHKRKAEPLNTRVRTLVVDDSPFMLKILAQILQEAGKFDLIGTASNGCQALRYVSTLSPDLVLMDVHMPRLNGIEATRYIKKREHPPIVIITTSDDGAAAKAMTEEAGADGFVTKDGNLRRQMIDALQKLFGPSSTINTVRKRTVPGCARFVTARACRQLPRTKPEPSTTPTSRATVRFPTDSASINAGITTRDRPGSQAKHGKNIP